MGDDPGILPCGIPVALRPGGLVPNPLVQASGGPPARLDAILAGRTAVLTARRPGPALADFCRRHGLVLVRISSTPGTRTPGGAGTREDAGWIDIRLADAPPGDADPDSSRVQPGADRHRPPDRVIAAVGTRCRLPRLPWYIPATAGAGHPAAAPPLAHPDPAGPLPAAS